MTSPRLSVKQLFDRESCTYTYLLIDPDTGEGAIIDSVLELFERDMQIINELGIELLYAIETHAHADHITAAGKIRETTGAKLVYGETSGIEAIDIPLKDGEITSDYTVFVGFQLAPEELEYNRNKLGL